ncbi:MAG TPA: VOC family protein [Candidatus Eisenbacteria bacterium]|nr:VOC family protein [Candidatus Eisenbacteria bacterium]
MANDKVRGRFIWHELMTTDPKAAAAFYTKVTGWKTESWPQNPSYTMFTGEAGAVAGYMELPADARAMGAPPSWLCYIGTPDLDQTLRLAQDLGGRVLKGTEEVPSVGRFAVLQDPQGAVFAAFTPVGGPMGDDKPKLGSFSWHELITTDWNAAFTFYQRLFGWEKTEAMDMGPMGTYQMYGWPGNTLGGMFNKPPDVPGPPRWLAYVQVRDSKAAAEAATRLGGRVMQGPMEVPGGDWIAQAMDPQGVAFAVHSKKAAAAKPAAKPAAKKAAAKKPAARKPAAKKAAAKKKPARRKAARKPARKKAAAKRRPAKKRAAKRPAKRRAARRPAARRTTRRKR